MTDHTQDSLVAIPILGGIGGILAVIVLVVSLPGLIGGIGLLQFKPWARILAIILSALDLFNIPFGTALGSLRFLGAAEPRDRAAFRPGFGAYGSAGLTRS